jgi:hypothetical protein
MASSYRDGGNLFVTTYNFKSNIGHYMRLLRCDPDLDSIVLKRYDKNIAMIVPIPQK